MFAAGQVNVRTSCVRGWLARTVSLDHNQQTSKKVKLTTQTAQIDREYPAPISKTSPSRRFQNERDSDSTQPIFHIETESVREKVHLSFAARRFFKSGVNFQKTSFEDRLHTKRE